MYIYIMYYNLDTVVQYNHFKADVGNMHDNDDNDDDMDDDVDDEHVNVASLMTAGEVEHDQHVR